MAGACSPPGEPDVADDAGEHLPGERPNVLVIVVDCLRADRLGADGLTPNLDELAAGPGGVRFDTAIAPATWTKPSIASLFTSVYPREHGIEAVGSEDAEGRLWSAVLPDGFTTLAEHFQASGYETTAVLNQVHLTHENGFAQGFDHFHSWRGKGAFFLNRKLLEWFDARPPVAAGERRQPFFAYLHYLDPHWPYNARLRGEDGRPASGPDPEDLAIEPPPPGRGNRAQSWIDALPEAERSEAARRLARRYDLEVQLTDHAIGRLLRTLGRSDALADTLVVVTSDHGEAFLERGLLQHGHAPHEELVRIPLVLRLPAPSAPPNPVRIDTPVSLVDLLPTLLSAASLPVPEGIAGLDLTPLWRGAAAPPRTLAAEGLDSFALRSRSHKLLRAGGETRFFDLEADPRETRPLDEAACGAPCRALRRAARDYLRHEARFAPESGAELSDEQIDDLESLGYL